MGNFPRVLFVTPVAFNPLAGGGATFASLFQGWPKDRLATVHNDPAPSPDDVCESYFILGPQELDFVSPFSAFRRRGGQAPQKDTEPGSAGSAGRPRWIDGVRARVLGDSIPEWARLTPHFADWIAAFRPEVIYTILGSNGMMSLIEQIRARFDLPLVVHIMDDWASAAHRRGLFAPLERLRMERHLAHMFEVASACLGISPAMCEAYARRYGRPFAAFQYALDREVWGGVHKRDLRKSASPELLYVGSIFPNAQLDSLVDCARAVASLNEEGFPLRLRIAVSPANAARFGGQFSLHSNVVLDSSGASDEAFFHWLANADALLLPVNFDKASVDFIRYSMPTKVPAYLNSGTPVLAYGSPETAQMRYAAESGWGLMVGKRSPDQLKDAIKRILDDMDLRRTLSAAARVAAAHHDARTVRAAFQELLRSSARR